MWEDVGKCTGNRGRYGGVEKCGERRKKVCWK